jgi:excisionase family DNA binding protein
MTAIDDSSVNKRRLVSVDEAAGLLSIGATVMREIIASREIESVKIHGRRLIPIKAIDAYIDKLLVESAP